MDEVGSDMHYAHLCSVCRSGYAHGPLSGLGDTAPTFKEAVSAAGAAMRSLDTKARLLLNSIPKDPDDDELRATDEAQFAIKFATVTGPMSLARAESSQDWDELKTLQRGLDGVISNVNADLRTSLINKFLSMTIVGQLKKPLITAADWVEHKIPPPGDNIFPWYVYVGGGVVALGIVGYFIRAVR